MWQFMKLLVFFLFLLVCTGCSLTYNLNPPIKSVAKYQKDTKKKEVVYVYDNRQDKKFMKGITGLEHINLKIGNINDPVSWLAKSLEKEFLSHNISVTFTTEKTFENSADAILTVNRYQIVNSRTSGFTPYVAIHLFSGSVKDRNSKETVVSCFVYGKVPVWSMDELQTPCFNMPESILIKGIAAKVNRFALHDRMNDGQLAMLDKEVQNKLNSSAPDAYLSVLELGESNNPKAISYLKPLAENKDTLIRACALSAFGMIGKEDTLEFLEKEYAKYTDIDRFMALKSIGDLGTPEALNFLSEARKDRQYKDEVGFKYIVDLYLGSEQKKGAK